METSTAWVDVYEELHGLDLSKLPPDRLEALADAAWWTSRVDEAIAARQKAHAGYAAAGNARRAAYSAWFLFWDHIFRGERAVANGWLRRAERLLSSEAECTEHGLVAFARGELALWAGDAVASLTAAESVTAIGERTGSTDLMALGIECRGRSQIARGNVAAGVADLDEAMCSVIADELSPLFTGWIYCHVLVACWDITDLRRAAEWTDAALRWCEVLPGTDAPFQGLCRIHRVEIATWRGDWAEADAEARRTCDELLSYEPNAAGMAFEAAGEVRRRMGDVVGAEAAFSRAHELGYEPQPGLALLELSRGQTAAAAAALELALTAKPTPGLPRAKLRAAQVDVALATDDLRTAADAVAELESFAERLQTPVARAIALHAVGTLELAEGSAGDSVLSLRRAVELWQEVGAPYEAALARERLATALAHAGDERGAKLEREVAHSVFRRLGAEEDVRRIERLPTPRDGARGALTSREVEVLRLVARGMTNREIAEELVISAHTVARHLNNIFAKLGVSTRTAATAYAFTHEIAQ